MESVCWVERLGALAEVGLELSNNKNEVSKKFNQTRPTERDASV